MVKIGDIVAYQNCCDEWLNASIAYIYDGDKMGICSILIPGLDQYFDYPINELMTKEKMG